MRRLAIGGLVVLVLIPACAHEDRPSGVVERWLLSLNQGAAGRPDRFAPPTLSEQVVAGWERLEPGHLDSIEVGEPAPDPDVPGGSLVPFRIVDVDGGQVVGVAAVAGDGSARRVTEVSLGGTRPGLRLPSEGGPTSERISAAAWLGALAAAAILALVAVCIAVLVRRSTDAASGLT